MSTILKKPYIFWFIGIFLLYLILDILVSGFYKTIPLIIIYASTVSWFKLGTSLILTLFIGFFIAMNSTLIIIKYRERKKCKKEIALNSAGTALGLAAGVCPLCVTGIFPLILGLIGVSFSFASLPFQGIEVQILIVLILLLSYKQISNHSKV